MTGRRLTARSGSLLVITLWVMVILSVLAIAVARFLSVDVRIMKYRVARAQARALAHGGVWLAIQAIAADAEESDGKTYDWLGDQWSFGPREAESGPPAWTLPAMSGSRGTVIISVADEERRLDVSRASPAILEALLAQYNADPALAVAIADHVDADTAGETPIEEPPYYPKNLPLGTLEELVDVPGVADLFLQVQPELTAAVTSAASPVVNVNTVSRNLLVAAGLDPGLAEQLTAARNQPGPDQRWGTGDDCRATDMTEAHQELADCAFGGDTTARDRLREVFSSQQLAQFGVVSSVFRVRVEAVVEPQQVRHAVEAIVRRGTQEERPVVIAWREG